ncbi:MAG: hypothetical protein BGP16_08670 [Sphingobium sp. 66-54]|nr:MAG: hypothetical protein BGP16_08670 [Sphingobium sp. 66-54]
MSALLWETYIWIGCSHHDTARHQYGGNSALRNDRELARRIEVLSKLCYPAFIIELGNCCIYIKRLKGRKIVIFIGKDR